MAAKLPMLPARADVPEIGEAKGCIECQKGRKMVLFVTGRCHWACDYCPLSENRRESPVMYANERPCTTFEDVIREAEAMNATGTGITGGDPMMDAKRTLEAISILKERFGMDHHIHLYTSLTPSNDLIGELARAGLDEMRFHPLQLKLNSYADSIESASKAGISVGIEVPCEPDKEADLFAMLTDIESLPIEFLNLNELEITIGNQDHMEVRGFNLATSLTAGAEGSMDLAQRIKRHVELNDDGTSSKFHVKVCSSSYKDAGQLRARFRRRGEASLLPHESLTEDDTVVFGVIISEDESIESDLAELLDMTGLPADWAQINKLENRIEIPLDLAEDLADVIDRPIAAIEVHPTHERLEVGLVWLNDYRPKVE